MLDTLIRYRTKTETSTEKEEPEVITLKTLGKNSSKCPEVRDNFAWFACEQKYSETNGEA